MRPSMLAASLLFVMLAGSVAAQGAPSHPSITPPSTGAAMVVMDAVFWTQPGDDADTCLQLPPGQLSITVRLEPVGTPQPVRYHFAPYWYRAGDAPAEIDEQVTGDPRTVLATLAGGRYCYGIVNEGSEADDDPVGSTGQAQLVAVKMLLTSQ